MAAAYDFYEGPPTPPLPATKPQRTAHSTKHSQAKPSRKAAQPDSTQPRQPSLANKLSPAVRPPTHTHQCSALSPSRFPFKPSRIATLPDPSLRYQPSLANISGPEYVAKHNAINYHYGLGHYGHLACHSEQKQLKTSLPETLAKLKRDLKKQERKLTQKAPTREQWASHLKSDFKTQREAQAAAEEEARVAPDLQTSWEVMSPEQEQKVFGTGGEYLPKSVTTKAQIYARDWGETEESTGDLRRLFWGQEAFLGGSAPINP